MSKKLLVLCVALSMLQQSAWAQCVGNNKPNFIYQDNLDGTVTDLKTKLVWQKCSVGLSGANCNAGTIAKLNWLDASRKVTDINISEALTGVAAWRLPSVAELRTLVNDACYDAAINENAFPATDATVRYWTSTPYFADSSDQNSARKAWYIDFAQGLENSEEKDTMYAIRLVKGSN